MAENSNIPYDSAFFQCYICMNNVKKPRMCPSCSKLACQSCLRKWIEDSKTQCPHCRKILPLTGFIDCERFVSDIKHLIRTIDTNQSNRVKEKCTQHKLQMQYYCQQCKQAICSDCGLFGLKHKGHPFTHLSKIYQQYKDKILNELPRFDQKIASYRKNELYIKHEMQKLMIQISQKKSFIEQYFLSLIERLQDEFRQKKVKLENQFEENSHDIELLQERRDHICYQIQGKSEKQVISGSQELISQIHRLCEKQKHKQFQQQEYSFQTIQQIVPKYESFSYVMQKFLLTHQGITYSQSYTVNGIEWRLKLYPRGNGVAKDTHISVFLQMSKAYTNENKYQYKIELVNHFNQKDTIVRQYSSKFDIGQCWGYNQFIQLNELQNGFMDQEGRLNFNISVRNPTYKSLVRDQQNYIKFLQNKLKNNEQIPRQKSRDIVAKLSKQSQTRKMQLKRTLMTGQQSHYVPQQYFNNEKNKLNYIQNIDNMAMLQADSIEDQYKLQSGGSSRFQSP